MKDKVGIGFPHAYRKYIKGGNAVKFNQGMANEVSRYILLFFLFIVYSGIFLASGLLCIYIGEVVIGLLVLPFGLLWLYLLMIGFIVGVILNSEKILKGNKKKKLKNKTL